MDTTHGRLLVIHEQIIKFNLYPTMLVFKSQCMVYEKHII